MSSHEYLFERKDNPAESDTQEVYISQAGDILAEMEAALDDIAREHPRLKGDEDVSAKSLDDLKALLQVSLATNSSLVLEDILKIVMQKAIELLFDASG